MMDIKLTYFFKRGTTCVFCDSLLESKGKAVGCWIQGWKSEPVLTGRNEKHIVVMSIAVTAVCVCL